MGHPIVEQAKKQNAEFLSEAESKRLLADYGVSTGPFIVTRSAEKAAFFGGDAGYPLVLKGCGRTLLHKTEMDLVRVGMRDEYDLNAHFDKLVEKLPADAEGILVSPMFDTRREFIAGLSIDPQFGPVVMFGLGGIFTEALKDVVFRICPISETDAMDMIEGIKSTALLDEVRGLPAVDKQALAKILLALSEISKDHPEITEIDINPILIDKGAPMAADALVRVG